MQVKRKYYFLAFSVVPLLFMMRFPAVSTQTQMASQAVMKPILLTSQNVSNGVSSTFSYFFLYWKTFETQQHNQQIIDKLENQLFDYEKIKKENERLKDLLVLKKMTPQDSISAKVIGRDMSLWKKTITLDKGKKEGLEKTMAVIVTKGVVGKLIELTSSTARVILLNDPDARIAVISVDTRSHGVISGDGSDILKMRYIDLDSGIKEGEMIMSSGMTHDFPAGLKIGVVRKIRKDKNGLHLVAEVEPFADLSKVEEVLCIKLSPKGS